MPIIRWLILCSIFVSVALGLQAQKTVTDTRSANDSVADPMQQILVEYEWLRLRDSLRAAILEKELQDAKQVSQSDMVALQEELARIRKTDSIRLQQQKEAVWELQKKTTGVPVMLYNDTLFHIYAPLGPFTGKHRARDAQEKIEKLYKATSFYPDSVKIVLQQGLYNISYGDMIITSVSLTDAIWVDKEQDSLASAYAHLIRDRISVYREANNFQHTMARVGYAALVIAILWFLLWIFQLLFKRIRLWIFRKRKKLPGVKLRNYQLLSPQYMLEGIIQILKIIKTLLIVLAVYLGLSVIFSIFPYTHNWASILLGWVWNPLKEALIAIVEYLPNLFTILVILFIARLVNRIFRFLSKEVEEGVLFLKGFHKEWAQPTYNIIRFFLYAFTFVLIFPYLPGSDSMAFKGVSVFLGIVFSLGSSSAVSNTIAGIVITYMRPFQNGDWIRVNDITGFVIEKSALVTRVRTIHNEDVTIPNAAILSGHTINYSSSGRELGLAITIQVSLSYDTPWEVVHDILYKAAEATKDVNTMQSPFIFQKELNDFYVTYELNAYTNRPERMYHIRSELLQHVLTLCKEAGVQLTSPHAIKIMEKFPNFKQ